MIIIFLLNFISINTFIAVLFDFIYFSLSSLHFLVVKHLRFVKHHAEQTFLDWYFRYVI